MSESLLFLKTALRHPCQIGAIAPSSPILAERMIRGIEPGANECIVELGPGTGVFTRALRDILPDPANYLGIEVDARFAGRLRKQFPEMQFVEGSAEDMLRHHRESDLPPVRAVVCGLPFGTLPSRVRNGVVATVSELLMPGGEFRTFQYTYAYPLHTAIKFRRMMNQKLGRGERSEMVFRNLPPAYVLTWTRHANGQPNGKPQRHQAQTMRPPIGNFVRNSHSVSEKR